MPHFILDTAAGFKIMIGIGSPVFIHRHDFRHFIQFVFQLDSKAHLMGVLQGVPAGSAFAIRSGYRSAMHQLTAYTRELLFQLLIVRGGNHRGFPRGLIQWPQVGIPMIIAPVAGISDSPFVKGMGNCPVSTLVFPGDELRIDDSVFIPLGQHCQSFFHFRLNGGVYKFTVFLHPLLSLIAKGSIYHIQPGGGKAIGIPFSVSIRILIGKLIH